MSGTILILVLLSIGIISVWLMDIGDVIGSFGEQTTNGFWGNDPNQIYHVGMYIAVAVMFGLSLTAFHFREQASRLKEKMSGTAELS
jgi:hypothetical protein